MSGGRLRVDYDALDELADILRGLKDEFDGMRDNIDSYRSYAGHDGVADKMDRAAKNWSDDRKKICNRMDEVCECGSAAAEAYREVDHGLGDEYDAAMS